MGSFGTIPLKEIWEMLDACAPGHTRRQRNHNWCITYGALVFPSLPLGPHGKRENVRIEIGHVRKMVKALGILDCARTALPQLG